MFDNLKNKLKGLFKKAPAEVAEPPAEEKPVKDVPDAPLPEVKKDDVKPAEKVTVPVPAVETPKPELSRKEQIKLAKEEKKKAKEEKKAEKKETDVGTLTKDSGLFAKKVNEKEMDEFLWELEIALMEADVALPVVEEIKEGVRNNLLGKKYSRGHTLEEIVELSLKDAVHTVLKLNEFDFDQWFTQQEKPVPIMFVGINGTGKTTAIAKIANRLMKDGNTVVLAAGDTFRAGAIEQLSIHADKLGCKIVKHAQDADPAAVAYDAIEHARSKKKDCILIDTAGRMQTNSNLIDEMKKIVRIAKPALKIFVGDSLAGNDAVEQAKAFDAAIGIDAIILTKIDADSKGGAALSIAHTIGKPIAFVCNGQEYDDIIKFDSEWMLNRLFE
ncbi:MAG: signal recognition particle-docking protein FtsY [Candidatus Methanomethylophilaceae archaeon]|nr:signal recognition particle-docking protein FtsY [Candidatus Methanomethylophilaceae archaeon]MDY5872024.1 signal recognition particle-docking protein FtsY [Candidatus Methanomethylophilaceae archaeon]